ncbi:hypothetical protein [Demequina activiva]|uniref:Uncharacterized protein n=1 Tax=Demequina activiva TaxID=1582364 RepID=A0A919Q5R2_9MICO|nr:hypothetical protein [Demequina activiva]GIG54320.1 hypothetical protein Dac01nite_10720 [Demequina activiva]
MNRDTDAVDERTTSDLVSDDVSTEPDTPAPTEDEASAPAAASPASAATASSPSISALSAADLDDGTPESDADPESDASDSDEADEPGTVVAPVPAAVAPDGRPHRRRKTDPPLPAQDHEPARRGRRAGWIVTTVLLLLLLTGSVLLNWHLWTTTDEWQARADALTDVNYDLGERLSREEQTTMQLGSEIDLLTQQLATSNQRVIDLGASKASAEDASEYASQQIDQLTTSLTNASAVANALHRCVDGQQQLVTYLENPDNYEPEELADYAQSVRQLCAAAESSNEQLREALSE